MTLSEQIYQILVDRSNGNYPHLSNTTPDLYRAAIHKALTYELIKPRGHTYDLMPNGEEVIKLESFDKWLEIDTQRKEKNHSQSINIKGRNISGINQGRDFSVLPQSQPESKPSQNASQTATHEVKISTGQFIFWLFSALATGIAIGLAIAKLLYK